MKQVLFVSDGDLIIDLLWKHGLYSPLMFLYKELYFPEQMKVILNSYGFSFTLKEIAMVERLFEKFEIGNESLIPDILFLQNVAKRAYKNTIQGSLPELGEQQMHFIDEIKVLADLFNETEEEIISRLTKIQLRFKRGKKMPLITIEDKRLATIVIEALKGFLHEKEQQLIINLSQSPLSHIALESLYQEFGKPSDKKDNPKIIIRQRMCRVLKDYLHCKNLCKIGDGTKLITNEGAEFIGRIINDIDLMDYSEEEFNKDKNIKDSYPTYQKYLVQKVKSYLSTGKNHNK
ncbi:MAG: hypothetical protein WAV93_12410 [Bacteroidales bacterium]